MFILSAYREGNTPETNRIAHMELREILEDHKHVHKELRGMWKGKKEKSYLVKCQRMEAIELAWYFQQDALIELYQPHMKAQMVYLDYEKNTASSVNVGTMTNVPESEAKACDGWTYDIAEKEYYVIKSDNGLSIPKLDIIPAKVKEFRG